MTLPEKFDREYTLPHTQAKREMPPRRARTWTAGFAIVAIIYLSWNFIFRSTEKAFPEIHTHWSGRAGGRVDCGRGKERLGQDSVTVDGKLAMDRELIPLEAHIMSKCPDAQVQISEFLSNTTCLFVRVSFLWY